MATLFIVSTPIGNLEDLSLRAGSTLAGCSRILAEDTRRTRILLDRVGVRVPLVSLHEHNEARRSEEVLGWLEAGEDLALVSDAGTPLVSDPGERLLARVIEAGHRVSPIPGPSAALSALVVSGLPAGRFAFLGFPPRKGPERAALLNRVADSEETTLLFESPERVGHLLEELAGVAGGGRRAALCRELTKAFEEVRRGTLEDLASYYREEAPRGEVVLVVGPGEPLAPGADAEAAETLAAALLDQGERPSRVAREVARRLGIARNEAYRIVQERRGEGS